MEVMIRFQVRCYVDGLPGELQEVDAETEIEAAEEICGGPLTSTPRMQVFCRAEVRRQAKPNKPSFLRRAIRACNKRRGKRGNVR